MFPFNADDNLVFVFKKAAKDIDEEKTDVVVVVVDESSSRDCSQRKG